MAVIQKYIKKLVFIVATIMVVSLPPAYSQNQNGEPESSLEYTELQRIVDRQRETNDQVKMVRSAEEILETEIFLLETEIGNVEKELGIVIAAISQSERVIASQENAIRSLEQQIEALKFLVGRRVVEMYMDAGSNDLVANFLLESPDSGTFEVRKILVQFANEKNEEVISQIDKTKSRISERKEKNFQRKDLLVKQKDILDQKNSELNQARQEVDLRKKQLENIGSDLVREITLLQGEEDMLLDILGVTELPDGTNLFINPPASTNGLIWPTEGILTSRFGMRWGALHQGIDIGAPTGTPIYASNDGRVIFSGTQGGYGKIVVIDHGDGFHTAYAHQSRLIAVAGDSMIRGQIIGLVGSTGNSTGPHLHFETRINGQAIDPLQLLENK